MNYIKETYKLTLKEIDIFFILNMNIGVKQSLAINETPFTFILEHKNKDKNVRVIYKSKFSQFLSSFFCKKNSIKRMYSFKGSDVVITEILKNEYLIKALKQAKVNIFCSEFNKKYSMKFIPLDMSFQIKNIIFIIKHFSKISY